MIPWNQASVLLTALVVLSACAPAGPATTVPGLADTAPTSPKHISAAIMFNPEIGLIDEDGLDTGTPAVMDLLLTTVSIVDGQGILRPGVAESIPSLENGLWRVFPDGRMETTWKLRPDVRWHDGVPFTSADLVFSATVNGDREVPRVRDSVFDSIEAVEATDPQTVVVKWSRPYIEADLLFSINRDMPMAKHKMENTYLNDKANFLGDPYWFEGYVGTGPFKMRDAVRDSHFLLEAYDGYFLGRPKVDTIEVKFIPDTNSFVANVLAGSVELTLSRNLSTEQAIAMRDQWKDGQVGVGQTSWQAAWPQFLNPAPAAVANLQFRKALMYALDRQEMADTLQHGVVGVAHSMISPAYPDYRAIEPSIVKYEHDQQRALQMIEGLGFTRAADGSLRDSSGEPLAIEIRATSSGDLNQRLMLAISGYWQRIGIAMTPVGITPTLQLDRAWRANYPAFEIGRQPNEPTLRTFATYRASQSPLAANNYRGSNRTRYADPEWNALLDQFGSTIPRQERNQVLARIANHMTDQLNVMGLFYDTEITLVGNRLIGVSTNAREFGATVGWNGREWDVR